MYQQKQTGFSLIELMIVIAILGILASIAIPRYYKYSQRGYRADCAEFLTRIAQDQERFYSEFRTYTDILVAPGGACVGAACGLGYTSDSSLNDYCTAGVAPLAGSTLARSYIITGTITDTNDTCLGLTFDSRGRRGNLAGLDQEKCW